MMIEVKEHHSLAPYTIYKIGGPARYFVEARSGDEIMEAVEFATARSMPFFMLGAGSNVLVSDEGYDGLVIRVLSGRMHVAGDRFTADAGIMMARAAAEAARVGLAGFEWAVGVPGTMGGSVRGNAGCFGGEIKDVVESVEVFDALPVKRYALGVTECNFSYRDSAFKRHPSWIVLSVTLRLRKDDPLHIRERIRLFMDRRAASQDVGAKCAGCVFKNIPWDRRDLDQVSLLSRFPDFEQFRGQSAIPVSYLIDHAGLKGLRMRGVSVSQRHANFFVNEGGAKAADVRHLIEQVASAVQKQYGLAIEEEIQYVGFLS